MMLRNSRYRLHNAGGVSPKPHAAPPAPEPDAPANTGEAPLMAAGDERSLSSGEEGPRPAVD